MLAVEAAKPAAAGALPLHVLLDAAIRHARDGYAVSRSQARLTDEKLAELKNVPGFADDVPARRQAAGGGRQAQAERACRHARASGAQPGSTISIAATSAARSPPIWSASAARSPARIWSSYEASIAEPLSVKLSAGTLYNTPPPTQGLASLIILALVRAAARRRSAKASITSTA